MGLLLGWHRAGAGQIRVDGLPLDGAGVDRLRRESAWVDPSIQLWNRSFLENLHYGTSGGEAGPLTSIIDGANLHALLENLPEGLQTRLGEGGALVSGGEGQRVRFGRAMMRQDARLVILDEPFRGLDREHRRMLLARAREWWKGATLICITHDIRETMGFDRALVVEGGKIVEDGAPPVLALRTGSHYASLLAAEDALQRGQWASTVWRRLRLDRGRVDEGESRPRLSIAKHRRARP